MSNKTEYLAQFEKIDFNKIVDHPNILIAARFWEEERYEAARICYKLMREIDDLIDNYKSENKFISQDKKFWFKQQVKAWLDRLSGKDDPENQEYREIINILDKFKIPLWPLETFARSMNYDIDSNGFPSFQSFLDYSQGATVAPSSIFVHLCGLRKTSNAFLEPLFDVREAAYPCSIFSYLVHIIRDFQKDQIDNLSYFADDLVVKHGLSCEKLKEIANGAEIPVGFRNLIKEYLVHTEKYRLKTIDAIERISPLIEAKCQLSLHIIFNLYLMVYERIDPDNGSFTSSELNPTPQEIKDRVYRTIIEFESK